jgi:hypothetical protein
MAGTLAAAAADARILIDLDRPASALENEWQEIQKALHDRVIAQVRLNFASGERYRYRHGHRWRFWRKVPLAHKA